MYAVDENANLLLEIVPRIMRSIRDEMRGLAKGRFTVPQFRILNKLRKEPLTNRELALWMGVTPPTMSRMIDILVNKKLVQRERDREDLRAQSLSLTALGKRETERIRTAARERFAERVRELDTESNSALAAGLTVLGEMFQ